jgi:hypothetical protein
MTSLNPDQVTADRLAGKAPGPIDRTLDARIGDGTLTDDPAARPPLVLNNRSFSEISDIVCGYVENAPGKWWLPVFGLSATIAGIGTLCILYLIITGVGVWGLNNQVAGPGTSPTSCSGSVSATPER